MRSQGLTASPKIKPRIADLGSPVAPGSPADFGKFVAEVNFTFDDGTCPCLEGSGTAKYDRLPSYRPCFAASVRWVTEAGGDQKPRAVRT